MLPPQNANPGNHAADDSRRNWWFFYLVINKIRQRKAMQSFLYMIAISSMLFMFCVSSISEDAPVVMSDGIHKDYFLTKWSQISSAAQTHGNVTILLWNNKMKSKKWTDFYGDFNEYSCPVKCIYTTEKSLYGSSDLVLFNARSVYEKREGEALPIHLRRPRDIWMIQGHEPPFKIYLDFAQYQNVFNWTSFPRPDSDVMTFYNNYEEVGEHEVRSAKQKMTETVEHFRNRRKMAGWVVSNCHSENHREDYVGEMRKYMHIDIGGFCGNNSDIDGDILIGRHENFINRYKFYISFENDNCRGYVTEKLWNALRQGAIPVVMGDSTAYQRYAPPGSYIDTELFDTPKDLVKYLNKVAQNETLYKTYFEWIAKYKIVNRYWCDVCTAVHNWNGVPQVYSNLHGWYGQDTCQIWTVRL